MYDSSSNNNNGINSCMTAVVITITALTHALTHILYDFQFNAWNWQDWIDITIKKSWYITMDGYKYVQIQLQCLKLYDIHIKRNKVSWWLTGSAAATTSVCFGFWFTSGVHCRGGASGNALASGACKWC